MGRIRCTLGVRGSCLALLMRAFPIKTCSWWGADQSPLSFLCPKTSTMPRTQMLAKICIHPSRHVIFKPLLIFHMHHLMPIKPWLWHYNWAMHVRYFVPRFAIHIVYALFYPTGPASMPRWSPHRENDPGIFFSWRQKPLKRQTLQDGGLELGNFPSQKAACLQTHVWSCVWWHKECWARSCSAGQTWNWRRS